MTQAGDELLASEHRLQVLLGCTKGIVFEFDRDARYLNVWTHDEQLLVRPKAELLGHAVTEVFGPAEGELFRATIQRVFDSGRSETIEYELTVQGGRRWFVADVVVPPPVAGREQTVVYLVRDVTAHKQLEEQLRQSQRLEAIGRLAGGIAHDFNNILTTIIGYSEMLLGELDATTAHYKHAQRIRSSAQRAAALTSQLLAYGRRQVLMSEDLDVNAVIEGMADMLQRLIGERIKLSLELESGLAAKVDRSCLEQVIMNLSINARDALGAGGNLVIRTTAVELDDAFCATREIAPGRYVELVAADDGAGMEPSTLARVFEPFFTTKELGKGTGLGLSTVYGIVKQSAGHIEVESAVGKGTRFAIYLPRVASPAVPAKVDSKKLARRPAAATRVLVAEDDEGVRSLLRRYLSRAGYDVVLAASGDEALGLARGQTIDLLVTDMVMPTMGGDALARALLERLPDLRILFISGDPDEGVPTSKTSLFLRKPFTQKELIAHIDLLLDPSRDRASRGELRGMLDEPAEP
jgi:PAS domain S-box-containing protein